MTDSVPNFGGPLRQHLEDELFAKDSFMSAYFDRAHSVVPGTTSLPGGMEVGFFSRYGFMKDGRHRLLH
jgi:hypothetical protein